MASPPRHRLFEAARDRAGVRLEQLWLDYLALGGEAGLLELDAYLQGLMPLSRSQEDVLAHALNEHLDELHRTTRLPYWSGVDSPPAAEDPLEVITELLSTHLRSRTDQTDQPET